MRQSTDIVGLRGENIFFVRMTDLDEERGPLFRPQFLGDKFPFADYLVMLEGSNTGQFFFVQVKTRRDGYTTKEKRLKIQVTGANLRGLASFPAPTYIVGVDAITEGVFIASANGESKRNIASMNTAFPLDRTNGRRLWDEVQAYWNRSVATGKPKMFSVFSDGRGS